jgi:hypothetical protein
VIPASSGPQEEGAIVLVGGRIVHAECDGAIGIEAPCRMLGRLAASFRRIPREASPRDEEPAIDAPTASVVMDKLVSLAEWKAEGILNGSLRTDAEIAAALLGCVERGFRRAGE